MKNITSYLKNNFSLGYFKRIENQRKQKTLAELNAPTYAELFFYSTVNWLKSPESAGSFIVIGVGFSKVVQIIRVWKFRSTIYASLYAMVN